jgi:hypothetical protein
VEGEEGEEGVEGDGEEKSKLKFSIRLKVILASILI